MTDVVTFRRPCLPAKLALALGFLALAASPAVAVPSATLEVNSGGSLNQSGNEWSFPAGETYSSCCSTQAFSISNTSSAGEQITKITIDLDDTSLFPDILWDPAEIPDTDGPVGDSAGIDYTVGSNPSGGSIAAHAGLKKRQGGYGAWEISPTGFDPGENAKFGIDIDPSSIKNSNPSATGGHINGLEIHGAAVTVEFSGGSTLTGDIIGFPGEYGGTGGKAVVTGGLPSAPGLARAGGASSPATVSDENQSVVVTGDPGAAGKLYIAEGNMSVEVQPQGGFDVNPYEANKAVRIEIIDFTIGADGTATVPFSLERTSDPNAEPDSIGLHYVTAYIDSGAGSGRVSDPLVLRRDPSADSDAPAVASTSPADGATKVPVGDSVSVTFDEAMDPGTLASGFTLQGPNGSQVVASITASANGRTFTLTPGGPLAGNRTYTALLGPGVADPAGNVLLSSSATSWSFTTGAGASSGPPMIPSGAMCVATPVRPPASSSAAKVSATVRQLRINQRISSAAIRRANAIQAWLDGGIVADDLCGAGLAARAFGSGIVLGVGSPNVGTKPSPRPLSVAKAGSPGEVTRSINQLRINQRISAAAVRRINGLTARMSSLTGGDIVDGEITVSALNGTTTIVSAALGATTPASTTKVAPASGGSAKFTLSAGQLRINQRISQAAVRRVNRLSDQIASGLTSANFADGSINAIDLEPGLRS